jgi:TM2 domain-containing membrane protein YozV
MAISVQEQMLIEQRVTNEAKSVGAAYLLWFFLGSLGAHRFYLGRSLSGAIMLILLVIGGITLVIGIGAILLIVVGIWALIDAFLIPGMVAQQKNVVRQRLTLQAVAAGGGQA